MKKKTEKHKARDGAGGFTAKNGEHDGKMVILFPGRFKQKFRRVVLVHKDGTKERMRYTGKDNPDSVGLRQHWRASKPIQEYRGFKVEAHQKTIVHIWRLRGARRGRID